MRARRSRSWCSSPSIPSAHPGAMVNGVGAEAPAPNSRANYVLLPQVLLTGQGGRDRRRSARNLPHPRPRARAAAPPARQINPACARHPPPASHARLALHQLTLPACAGVDTLKGGGEADADADDAIFDVILAPLSPPPSPSPLPPPPTVSRRPCRRLVAMPPRAVSICRSSQDRRRRRFSARAVARCRLRRGHRRPRHHRRRRRRRLRLRPPLAALVAASPPCRPLPPLFAAAARTAAAAARAARAAARGHRRRCHRRPRHHRRRRRRCRCRRERGGCVGGREGSMGEGRGRDGSRGRMGQFGPQLCIFWLVFTFFCCTTVISVSKVLMGRLAVSESVLYY